MIRLLLIAGGIYLWHKSQTTGQGIIETAQSEVDALLSQLQQQNPPQPVNTNLRIVGGGAMSTGTGSGSPYVANSTFSHGWKTLG